MVLQDLSPPDDFGDGSSSSGEPSSSLRFDPSDFPKPIPWPTPFPTYSPDRVYLRTQSVLKYAESRVHRPLTSEESQALAMNIYMMEQRMSWATAAGSAMGAYRWYSTMATNSYPFYKPKPGSVDPNKFAMIKGPLAQPARLGFRLLCYYIVGAQVGKMVGQIFAQRIAAQNSQNDPRLAQFGQDLKMWTERDSRALHARLGGRGESAGDNTDKGLPPHAGAPRPWGQPRRQPPPPPPTNDDDMSPTAGNESWTSEPDFGFAPEPQEPVQTERSPARHQPMPMQRHPRPAERRPTPSFDEDASPTGGMFQEEVQSQNKPGESSWDRLRRGQMPKSQSPPKEQREGSTLGDSWAFADSDEERRRARQRSQKEFDERLERERQGKDFNDEKRW